jgi:hypothetical protein
MYIFICKYYVYYMRYVIYMLHVLEKQWGTILMVTMVLLIEKEIQG